MWILSLAVYPHGIQICFSLGLYGGVVKAEIVLGMWRCHCWAYFLEYSWRKLVCEDEEVSIIEYGVQGHFQENAGGRDMPPRYA